MRVLLAEDDKRLGKLIQYMLERGGVQPPAQGRL